MPKVRICFVAMCAPITLASCSFTKSSICNSEEINQALTSLARQERILFEQLRSTNARPPYLSNPSLTSMKSNLQQNKAALNSKTASMNQNVEKCRQISDGGYLGTMMALGSAMNPEFESQTSASCSGDFSFWTGRTAMASGEEMFALVNPNRHRFWRKNIRGLAIEIDQLSQSILDLGVQIEETELDLALKAYTSAKMYINSASLEFSNKENTVHTCSAFLNVEADRWAPVKGNINYEVKITDDGGKKIVLKAEPKLDAQNQALGSYNS